MQAHFQCAGKASDTVRSQLGKRPGDLIYASGLMPEGRVQIHPGFAQSVPSAFLTHLPLKIQGRIGAFPIRQICAESQSNFCVLLGTSFQQCLSQPSLSVFASLKPTYIPPPTSPAHRRSDWCFSNPTNLYKISIKFLCIKGDILPIMPFATFHVGFRSTQIDLHFPQKLLLRTVGRIGAFPIRQICTKSQSNFCVLRGTSFQHCLSQPSMSVFAPLKSTYISPKNFSCAL